MGAGIRQQMARTERLRARELRILNAVAEALNSATDVRQALERTLALAADLFGLRTGWVWLLDADTGRFYSGAVRNLPPYLQEPVRMTGEPCWCIEAFLAGRLTPKNIDVLQCSRLRRPNPGVPGGGPDEDPTEGLRSHASIPLYFQGKPLGILNLAGPTQRAALTDDELRLLSTIGYQVGIAVERGRLAQEGTRLARAEERARIAREIHDTLAQGLTGIALHIEGAMNHLETDPGRARERLGRALAMSRESLEEARRSAQNLRAAPLESKPLGEALGALARRFTSETGIRVPVRLAGDRALPLAVEAELFRIAQEALANVRRHARATGASLLLGADSETVRLVVKDNGVGFQTGAAGGGNGIPGMRERARLLGGGLRITSRPGRGTTLTAWAPLTPEAGRE